MLSRPTERSTTPFTYQKSVEDVTAKRRPCCDLSPGAGLAVAYLLIASAARTPSKSTAYRVSLRATVALDGKATFTSQMKSAWHDQFRTLPIPSCMQASSPSKVLFPTV
jgi:hypothetical protein